MDLVSIWVPKSFQVYHQNNLTCVHVYLCVCPCVYILSCSVMSNSCDPIECNLSVSSVHVILQARILKWVAISFSRESSQPRNQTWVSCIAGRFFTDWAMREIHVYIWIRTHTHTHTHTHNVKIQYVKTFLFLFLTLCKLTYFKL